jgi:uncharacterized protein (DUF427 family)
MTTAVWNGVVIADSDDTVVVEGNHYFPAGSVNADYLKPSATTTVCTWKGVANYYTVTANGEETKDAAWYYPEPSSAAAQIKDHIAFWRGVKVK